MPDLFQQESPLVQINFSEPKGNAPRIEEVQFLGYLNIRGKTTDMAFVAAMLKVLGCEPPSEANTVVDSGDYRIYWLGPDEWLVTTPTGQAAGLQSELQAALTGVFSSVVDNSSGLTMLRIIGDNAASLLARDCPLDLHPREFKPGQCAQTRLARAGMTIALLSDNSGFEIIIRRSFADYIGLWMQDALVEFI
ncbi:MAG: sarcosine oxidase subunit gamma [bacterium]|nr:sarcosine oxidase subunit gamma [bacterium]